MISTIAVFILSFVAIGFPVVMILGLFHEFKFTAKATGFKGQVIDFERVRVRGWMTYAPVVDWIGPDGKTRRTRCGDRSTKPRYEIGQRVIVLCGLYKKDLRVRIKSFREQFFVPICFLVFGLIGLGLYTFVLIKNLFP